MQLLLVEDDDRLAQALVASLARYKIRALRVTTGRHALAALDRADIILLDLALPDTNGIEVCRQIRAMSEIPIIILTGPSGIHQRILGLRSGADDYVDKPFNIDELLARIQAVRRRRIRATTTNTVHIGDVEIDLEKKVVTVADTPVKLSRKEFQILAMLANDVGSVCARQRLIAELWGRTWSGAHKALNVHIFTLREKMDRPGLIQTVRGVGYRLTPDQEQVEYAEPAHI